MDFFEISFDKQKLLVSKDYYTVGDIRVAVGLEEAMDIVSMHRAMLPTPAMVDAIWKAADLKLTPTPLPPGPQMSSPEYIEKHNNLINEQIGNKRFNLVAGHKKDIVQPMQTGRVTIYGWHRTNGRPIQPVSSVHSHDYYDYSHGVRLVKFK